MKLKLTLVLFLVLLLSLSSVNAGTISKPPYLLTLTTGLVGHWTFDGASVVNGVARDISGQGNHGNTISIATSTFYTAGKIGQGLQFDGVDDEIPFDSVTAFDFSTANRFTISAWVKPDGNNAGDIVLSRGSVFTSPDYVVYHLGISNTNLTRYQASISDGTNQLMLNSPIGSVVVNQWQHLSLVWDGTTLVLYKDGVSVGSVTGTFTGLWNGDSVAKRKTSIGANGMDDNFYFDGGIDDVRVYNRALSAAEIAQLYNFGASKLNVTKTPTGLRSGLVGHWTFDGKDMSGGVARDISGQGNHGNTVSIATSTFYTQGRIGQGVKFDGVDDYVNVPAATSINDLNTITACVWVNPPGGFGVEFQSLIIKTNDAGTTGWDLYLRNEGANGTGVGTSFAGGGNFDYIENRTPVVLYNVWSHVCMTQNGDGSANMKLYVNGVNVNIQGSRDSGTRVSDSSNTLKIGSNTSAKIKGVMDDARVYNRVLTASEITFLYSLGAPKQNVTISPTGLKSGLVGHWTFDGKDMSGGVARDISGQGNHGNTVSIATSTFYTQGRIGQGANFDGVDDYISFGSIGLMDAEPFSVSVWFYADNPVSGASQVLVSSSDSAGLADTTTDAQYVMLDGSGQITAFSHRSTSGAGAVGPVASAKTWYHVVGVYENSSLRYVYINGALYTSNATSENVNSPDNFRIGSRKYSGGESEFFDGKIDDLRIYNRLLSASEILQLYNMGK